CRRRAPRAGDGAAIRRTGGGDSTATPPRGRARTAARHGGVVARGGDGARHGRMAGRRARRVDRRAHRLLRGAVPRGRSGGGTTSEGCDESAVVVRRREKPATPRPVSE